MLPIQNRTNETENKTPAKQFQADLEEIDRFAATVKELVYRTENDKKTYASYIESSTRTLFEKADEVRVKTMQLLVDGRHWQWIQLLTKIEEQQSKIENESDKWIFTSYLLLKMDVINETNQIFDKLPSNASEKNSQQRDKITLELENKISQLMAFERKTEEIETQTTPDDMTSVLLQAQMLEVNTLKTKIISTASHNDIIKIEAALIQHQEKLQEFKKNASTKNLSLTKTYEMEIEGYLLQLTTLPNHYSKGKEKATKYENKFVGREGDKLTASSSPSLLNSTREKTNFDPSSSLLNSIRPRDVNLTTSSSLLTSTSEQANFSPALSLHTSTSEQVNFSPASSLLASSSNTVEMKNIPHSIKSSSTHASQAEQKTTVLNKPVEREEGNHVTSPSVKRVALINERALINNGVVNKELLKKLIFEYEEVAFINRTNPKRHRKRIDEIKKQLKQKGCKVSEYTSDEPSLIRCYQTIVGHLKTAQGKEGGLAISLFETNGCNLQLITSSNRFNDVTKYLICPTNQNSTKQLTVCLKGIEPIDPSAPNTFQHQNIDMYQELPTALTLYARFKLPKPKVHKHTNNIFSIFTKWLGKTDDELKDSAIKKLLLLTKISNEETVTFQSEEIEACKKSKSLTKLFAQYHEKLPTSFRKALETHQDKHDKNLVLGGRSYVTYQACN